MRNLLPECRTWNSPASEARKLRAAEDDDQDDDPAPAICESRFSASNEDMGSVKPQPVASSLFSKMLIVRIHARMRDST